MAHTHRPVVVARIPRPGAEVVRIHHREEAAAVRNLRPEAAAVEAAGCIPRPEVVAAAEVPDSHPEVAGAVARPTLTPP